MHLIEKYEGDALKNEIEEILETLQHDSKKNSKESSKDSSLKSQNLSKRAGTLKMKKAKSAFPDANGKLSTSKQKENPKENTIDSQRGSRTRSKKWFWRNWSIIINV